VHKLLMIIEFLATCYIVKLRARSDQVTLWHQR